MCNVQVHWGNLTVGKRGKESGLVKASAFLVSLPDLFNNIVFLSALFHLVKKAIQKCWINFRYGSIWSIFIHTKTPVIKENV